MHLTVKGKQLDVGEALRTHVADTLAAQVGKYFANPLEASVVLSREAHLYTCDIQVHVGRGILVQAAGEAGEPYPAFDEAVDKVAKRLRRHKRRLRDHDRTSGDILVEPPLPARRYILEAPAGDLEDEASEPDMEDVDAAGQVDGDAPPVIVAEMEAAIDMLTVGEAVMRLDLTDQPALMFRNRAHGGLNMVYRRADGNIGWVDPADGARTPAG